MRKPIPRYLSASLGLLWLWSGIQPLLTAPQQSLALLAQLGIPMPAQWPLLLAASAWDVLLGVACFSRWRAYSWLWAVQLATVLAYSVLIAVGLPEYWLHPFAPLLKNLPIAALMLYLWQQSHCDLKIGAK